MVNKIITYESTSPDEKPWFNKMIGVGGRTFDLMDGQPDGEYACDLALDYMSNLTTEAVRVYASIKIPMSQRSLMMLSWDIKRSRVCPLPRTW